MTRVNCGVAPSELPDKLLLAEHREITRIPNAVRSGRCRLSGIPETFRLGAGHVKFFYDKLTYLERRYHRLRDECVRRGFRVTDKSSAFERIVSADYWNNYEPTARDRQIIVDRIHSKGFALLSEAVLSD